MQACMAKLHMSKVAVGCASLDALQNRQRRRITEGMVRVATRFRPKRADELVGGSLYWIVKHRITARQTILGFAAAGDRRTLIHLCPDVVPVKALPKRAHQGWRYLEPADAPIDYDGDDDGILSLPPALASRLAGLALI
jgi:hypothetical protein